ncbi:MAG: hypothetical protein LBU11_03265 [Zoogloeaceae bacterium]|jgi:hypothetical protein|nr:hypothetical protein [Zoogloeaceae bacterium]
MKKTAIKLGVSIAAMPLSILMLRLAHNGFFFLLFMAGLLFSILYWFDLGHQLRNAANKTRFIRFLGIIMGMPQALFGLVCVSIGLAIVVWVLYNTFVDRQPEYTGGFLAFGIGPLLILFGIGLPVSAFRSESNGPDRGHVAFDAEQVTRTLPDGRIESVRWADLQEVSILTTDEGPMTDDVIWMLHGQDNGGCAVPSETEGMQELLPRLQELPGFDNEAVLNAMGSAGNAIFICWKRAL